MIRIQREQCTADLLCIYRGQDAPQDLGGAGRRALLGGVMSDIQKLVTDIHNCLLPGNPTNDPEPFLALLGILIDLHEHLTRIEEALNENNP